MKNLNLQTLLPDQREKDRFKKAYQQPRLEPLGHWHTLTLAMSLPIGPGGHYFDPTNEELA